MQRKRILCMLLIAVILLFSISGSNRIYAQQLEEQDAVEARLSSSSPIVFYFDHYYDADSFNATKRSYIPAVVNAVHEIYESTCADCDYYGDDGIPVAFLSSSGYTADTVSGMDNCPLEYDEPCASISICGNIATHHKDIQVIANNLYRRISRGERHITVLWTDMTRGTYCYYNDEDGDGVYVHEYPNLSGVVFQSRPVIHIMNLGDPTTAAEYQAYMTLILAHETFHTLGLHDTYEQGEHLWADGYKCVMDYFRTENDMATDFYEDIVEGRVDPFCTYCENCIYGVILDFE